MNNKTPKSPPNKINSVIFLQQKIAKLQTQILKFENKILKFENKTLKQEQKILKLQKENTKLKEVRPVVSFNIAGLHDKPPKK